jgi:hypothetical protein
MGYRVFPCIPGTKHPITQHGFHDASTDPAQIERWWARHPRANVGIAAEGMLVVDIDGADNPWPGDPEHAADLAGAGAIALTPRGGRHYLFRRPEGKSWKCSTGRLALGVDVRTDGGYIVAAPSEIEEGPYRWGEGLELDDPLGQLPDPPTWLMAALDALASPERNGAAHDSHTPAPVAAGDAKANPIPVGQRNATLARLAGTMRRVGMAQPEITAALRETNRTRCLPPLADAEVDRIAASIARYPADEVSVALAENHYEQMQAEVEDDDTELPFPDPGPVSDELLRVPGFIDEVMRYTLATAPYPEPVMAFAGALALQALLAGRKVRDGLNNRTNLYILSLAFSGVGKDHPRKVNARILQAIGMSSCLGNSFASGEGIEDSMFVYPASLYQVDEIDGLLLRVSRAKDARYEAIVSMLLQLYSSADGVYTKRAKAGREREQIDQPCLCLLGTAGPKLFYESLSPRMMTNGFLARMLVVECRGRGVGREEDVDRPLPASIVEAARWWADFRPGGNLDQQHPNPVCVPTTPQARRAIKEFKDAIDQGPYATAQARLDDPGMALWSRAGEKAHRLALIYACSADRENPVITFEAAQWATAFAMHQTQRMVHMMHRHASESEFDAKRKRLLDILERWRALHGDAWMPGYKVNRQLPWSIREHEEVRDTLFQQRLIEYQAVPPGRKGGRPGMCYRLRPTPENAP